jgi:alkylresorcinol/alkylpyrone synthase
MTDPHSASIFSVGRALPPHYADQAALVAALQRMWTKQHFNAGRVEELHRAVKVTGRHLALPLSDYEQQDSFQKNNDVFVRVAVELGEKACLEALERAGLEPQDVDHIFFVTVTGIAVPSVDARLVNRLGLRPDVKRTPIFGLGCVAGAAGLARASDYLRAFPNDVALLLSTELCSLTLQRGDVSVPNLIASGLFGDGAAAVVLGGPGSRAEQRRAGCAAPGPRILATRSVFYPETERVMGWDMVDSGFKIVLSAGVPQLVHRHIGGDVDAFLGAHGLQRSDIRHFIAHTGGPKVLQAFAEALALPPGALQRSWDSLEQVGNLSSASVLFVLRDTLDAKEGQPGDLGLLLAMGPGFCAELVLLEWAHPAQPGAQSAARQW